MRAQVIREIVRHVAGGIDAAELRCFSNSTVGETADVDIGCAEIRRIGHAGIEAERRQIEAVGGVVKCLVEVIHAHQKLIHHARCNHVVVTHRIIRLAARYRLEILPYTEPAYATASPVPRNARAKTLCFSLNTWSILMIPFSLLYCAGEPLK